jgi:hypothetical protein
MTFVNCDLTNNAGHPVVATDRFLYFIACRFYTGARKPIDLADSVSVTLEGCRLLRPAGSEAGLCFTDIFGYDNNFFEQVIFYNCKSGLKQLATTGGTEVVATINYMDKNVFYQCQWLNCGKALDLTAIRASGGNSGGVRGPPCGSRTTRPIRRGKRQCIGASPGRRRRRVVRPTCLTASSL